MKTRVQVWFWPNLDSTPNPEVYDNIVDWGTDELGSLALFRQFLGERNPTMVALYHTSSWNKVKSSPMEDDQNEDDLLDA